MKKQMLPWLAAAGAVLTVLVVMVCLVLAKPQSTIGICYRDNTTQSLDRSSLEQRLMQQGYKLVTVDADGDQAKQIERIAQLKEKNCKALLVEPVMTAAAGELLTALEQTGLPAVLFGRWVDTAQAQPGIAWVGEDVTQAGRLQGQLLAELPEGGDLNGDGVVSCLILQGPEDHITAAAGAQALEKALADSPFVSQCIDIQYGDWSQESGRRLCKQALAAYGKDIEVVFCGSDAISRGALEAITDGGRTVNGDIYLIAVGEDKTAVHSYSGMVWRDREKMAQTVCDRLAAMLEGTPTEQITVLDYTVLTH